MYKDYKIAVFVKYEKTVQHAGINETSAPSSFQVFEKERHNSREHYLHKNKIVYFFMTAARAPGPLLGMALVTCCLLLRTDDPQNVWGTAPTKQGGGSSSQATALTA